MAIQNLRNKMVGSLFLAETQVHGCETKNSPISFCCSVNRESYDATYFIISRTKGSNNTTNMTQTTKLFALPR